MRLCLKEEGEGRFLLEFLSDCPKEVRIRVPGWAGDGFSLSVNGDRIMPEIINGYAALKGGFPAGSSVRIDLPYTVRKIPSGDGKASLAYGPYILAAISEKADYMKAPRPETVSRAADGSFVSGTIKMLPAYRIDREAYHMIMED